MWRPRQFRFDFRTRPMLPRRAFLVSLRVLEGGRRFKNIWLTEPDFQLDLVEEGFCGVAGPDAVAGHRIQPELLQPSVVLDRARREGKSKAWLRLQPYRK